MPDDAIRHLVNMNNTLRQQRDAARTAAAVAYKWLAAYRLYIREIGR
jgi:hypothetical protein